MKAWSTRIKKQLPMIIVITLVLYYISPPGLFSKQGLGILMVFGLIVLAFAMLIIPGVLGGLALRKIVNTKHTDSLEADFHKQTNGIDFQVDKIIGVSGNQARFDLKNQKVYIVNKLDGKSDGKVYDLSDMYKYSSGSMMRGNYQKYYLDLLVKDISCPRHRIWFGGNSTAVDDATAFIDLIWRENE